MEENKKENKLTYEQLTNKVAGLEGLNNQLMKQIQQVSLGNLFKRIDYLFKILENKEAFSEEVIIKTSKEIEEFMFNIEDKK